MSDQPKFTPGPWEIVYDPDPIGDANEPTAIQACHTFAPWASAENGQRLAIICTLYESDFPGHEANARLIAAAPDLYEACSNVLVALNPEDVIAAHAKCAAAIAKANGTEADPCSS